MFIKEHVDSFDNQLRQDNMAEKLGNEEIVPLEEVVLSHAYEMSALVMLLES